MRLRREDGALAIAKDLIELLRELGKEEETRRVEEHLKRYLRRGR